MSICRSPSPAAIAAAVAAACMILCSSASAQAPTASPPAGTDCTTQLFNLSDCLSYVVSGSNATKPDKACCPELAGLLDSNPICLCDLLGGAAESYGIQIDNGRAVGLPKICKGQYFWERNALNDDFIVKSACNKWRDHKSVVKGKVVPPRGADWDIPILMRASARPAEMADEEWQAMLDFWRSERTQELADKNIENRGKKRIAHTTGSTPYSTRRAQTEAATAGGVGLVALFETTHRRSDGSWPDADTARMAEEMTGHVARELEAHPSLDRLEVESRVWREYMGAEHSGRVRGVGLGPTPTQIWGTAGALSAHRQAHPEPQPQPQPQPQADDRWKENFEERLARLERLQTAQPTQRSADEVRDPPSMSPPH